MELITILEKTVSPGIYQHCTSVFNMSVLGCHNYVGSYCGGAVVVYSSEPEKV